MQNLKLNVASILVSKCLECSLLEHTHTYVYIYILYIYIYIYDTSGLKFNEYYNTVVVKLE